MTVGPTLPPDCNANPDPPPERVSPPKVGEAPVSIFCGRERVILPVDADTVAWVDLSDNTPEFAMLVPEIDIPDPAVRVTEPVDPPKLVTPELVIVVPLIDIPLPALKVTSPVVPWNEVTNPLLSRLMVGVCPPVDLIPFPAVIPYSTLDAVRFPVPKSRL